ncbi:MAG: histidine phosphatase family protein [Actinobacteria bacterium]|nr:histidine phosphatase family protein [Actinomycetota bacterium]MDQ3532681.1 histidine phosphatase family protein [Actinomycetota bacterium]
MRTTVHLVRHGQVENPKGVIYGRLPGYHLSERGLLQAQSVAQRLAGADVGGVWASPLERAQETAAIIATPHGLDVITDERLTESANTLEGLGRTLGALLRSPKHLWGFRNPMKPSWGESFAEVKERMLEVIEEAMAACEGRETVIVSHQTPVLVSRLALARRRVPPWLGFLECSTGSVTSMVLDDKRLTSASYFAPGV